MKVTLLNSLRHLILLASVLAPAITAYGQVPGEPGGNAVYSGTYPHAPAYYDPPLVGYQSQSALQTASQQDAANAVFEQNVGYSLRAPFGPSLGFDGIFGDRRGIEGNDYSVYGFFPWHVDPNRNVIFAITRGTATDLGDFVGNFGIGQRMYFDDLNRIIGGSVWYDIDDSHNATYHRAGAQLEYLGRYLELRGGADIVLDDNQTLLNSGFTNDNPFFRGNNVLFNFLTRNERAYDQGYIEAGGPMPVLGRYGINAYAGAYYVWHDDGGEALGWSIRTNANITRDVQAGVRITNDDIFGSNTSVNVSFTFPNGGLKQVFRSPRTIVRGQNPDLSETNQVLAMRPGSVQGLLGSNVVRDFRMPVNIETNINGVLAIDPTTGLPVCIIHVDPNQTDRGDGSFANPFNSLETARIANDGSCRIIRVVPRDDGTGTNLGVTDPFMLFLNQRLLASSSQHLFDTTRGTFTLPGFTGAGPGPLVTNVNNGDLINMGNNTEVSGFQLVGSATGSGIVGSPVGFDINRNILRGGLNGVNLTNATGVGVIEDNTATGNVNNGISINNPAGGTLTLIADGNTLTGNGADGGVVSVTNGVLVGTIVDNIAIANNGNGFTINAMGSIVDFRNAGLGRVVTGNAFAGNGGDGFLVNATMNSTVDMRFLANTFGTSAAGGTTTGGNTGNGLHVVADSGWLNIDVGGPQPANGNLFLSNMDSAAQFDLTGTADLTLLFQNNLIGIAAPGAGGNVLRMGFNGNSLAANDDGSTGLVPIGFNANFFGQMFNQLFVNNNGNVTFNQPLGTFTPFPIVTNGIPIIAPFFADVDTRQGNIVTYGQGTIGTQQAFGVNYIDVRHFSASGPPNAGLPTNSFQLVLIDRSDISAGDFDIEFNYDRILWEAGQASGSDPMGLGGSSARAGFSNGSTNSFELAGSGVNGAFLDSGPPGTSLIQNNLNSSVLGRYVFEARSGGVNVVPAAGAVDGLQINTDGNAVVKQAVIDQNQFASLSGTAINVQANTGSTVDDLQITNNNINAVGRNGIRLAAGTLANINLTNMTNNVSSGNGLNGFAAEATGGGLINIANVSGNTFSGNGQDGAFIRANGPASIVAGAIGVNGQTANMFNENIGFGLNFEATDGGSIFGPGQVGNFLVRNNVIGAAGAGNGRGGVNAFANAVAPTISTLNLSIGGPTLGDGNSIVGNTDVGVGYSLQNNSVGQLAIQNNMITNTVDDAGMATPTFLGQGVYIEVAGTSMLNNGLIDANTITGNASHGVQGFVRESGMVTNFVIGNVDGDNDNGNTIDNNGGDGIRWQRRDTARVINMDIFDNSLMSNAGNGLNLIAQNASLLDSYDVNDNIISGNTMNGVRLRVEADADLSINMDNNLITMNTLDGVDMSESLNTATDTRSITGTWTNNTITGNMAHGIDSGAATNNLIVGTTGNGNLISMNGLDGVNITGPGSATYTDNQITFNGTGGVDFDGASFNTLTLNNNNISNNSGIGVDIVNNDRAFNITINLNNNRIDSNTGDGLEINGTGAGANLLIINSDGNMITRNMGRGVDILNQVSADSIMSFNNETIISNELEAFYVVNTASATQNQTNPATMALAADGAVNTTPTLNLSLTNSAVAFNGNSSAFGGTGLVLRVGTSDGATGPQAFADPGGFASDGRGGIVANVVNNAFGGNFGDDVLIESFVSTVDPATGVAWTDQNENPRNNANDVFNPAGYQADPLARLDLNFVGNTGDSTDVTRAGASYNNNDPVFKSRTVGQDNATDGGPFDDPGPFNSGTRARNAQRLAAREINIFGDFTDPSLTIVNGGNNSDDFLYPGVGDVSGTMPGGSTFRITAASDIFTAGFAGGDDFTDVIPLGVGFGELPFVWDIMP